MKKIMMLTAALLMTFSAYASDPNPPTPVDKEIQIGLHGVFIPGSFDSNTEAYVVVNGIFPNGCYKWGRAEVAHINTFTHEIKSYANVTPGLCTMVLIPFQKDVRLGKLSQGEHTLRFLSGDGTYLDKAFKVE